MVTPSGTVLLAVGDELLSGRTRDSNLYSLGGILGRRGLPLREARVVRDDTGAIAAAVTGLLTPGTLLVTTGGLGPTPDDMTLQGVAAALDLPIETCPDAVRMLEDRASSMAETLPPAAFRQAELPRGAVPVKNPAGMAPGVVVRARESLVICLPGVPSEALALLPPCLDAAGIPEDRAAEFYARTWGMREIDIYRTLAPLHEVFGCSPAYLPSPGRVDLNFAGGCAGEFRNRAAALLGSRVYAQERDITLEEVLAGELLSRGLTAAVAESCTGGMIAAGLTGIPGASEWFSGGVTAYSNPAKTRLLGVPPELIRDRGAVSRETALAMARGAMDALDARCAVAVTGIAGPSGGSADKPVGTVWIAACRGADATSSLWKFAGGRESVRLAASSCALGTLLDLVRNRG
jgi:nicotinamide-nucleotide amidase